MPKTYHQTDPHSSEPVTYRVTTMNKSGGIPVALAAWGQPPERAVGWREASTEHANPNRFRWSGRRAQGAVFFPRAGGKMDRLPLELAAEKGQQRGLIRR